MGGDLELEEFARRLRQASQSVRPRARAAEMAGVALPTWQRYLSGEREPGVLAVGRFSRAAGIPLDWLVYGRETARPALDEQLLAEILRDAMAMIAEQRWVIEDIDRFARIIATIYADEAGDDGRRRRDAAARTRLLRLVK